tara:strand:+ start:87 stop:1280 length:1194 start_codon:yes stop_codon:yes gene_type:complete
MEFIKNQGIDAVKLVITSTGYEKSIMDAIYPLRELFLKKKFHDYSLQKKGTENKEVNEIGIIEANGVIKTKISLYRPETKDGDPRLWVYGLKEYVKPNDEILFLFKEDKLFVLNTSKYNVDRLLEPSLQEYSDVEKDQVVTHQKENFISDFFKPSKYTNIYAKELLDKIKSISNQGYLLAKEGDKEVGEVLERALGIKANSSQKPDYKGIEIKSKFNLKTRANLFAKVPNYSHPLSKISKIYEIADIFGYKQDGFMVLRNTISAKKPNSQRLFFRLDFNKEILFETTDRDDAPKDFAVWEFSELIKSLEIKHKETFWVEASKKEIDGKKYFHYKKITHTLDPKSYLMPNLIQDGTITMDHLIKPNSAKTGRKESGPLFKIKPSDISALIPIINNYEL